MGLSGKNDQRTGEQENSVNAHPFPNGIYLNERSISD